MKFRIMIAVSVMSGICHAQELKIDITPPSMPSKVKIHNGDPFANWDLDKESPERIVVFIKDSSKIPKEVTWGEILEKGESRSFPSIDYVHFTEPYKVRVTTTEYGRSEPFKQAHPGDVLAAWHGVNPVTKTKTYNFICRGKKSCEAESKELFDALKTEWDKQHAKK